MEDTNDLAVLDEILTAIQRDHGQDMHSAPVLGMLAAIDAIFFAGLRTIVSFAAPAIAWLAGIYTGRGVRWLLGKLGL